MKLHVMTPIKTIIGITGLGDKNMLKVSRFINFLKH